MNSSKTTDGITIDIDSVYDATGSVYLHDIQIDMQPGEMIGVLGNSKSGKSLLLKTLSHANRLDKLYSIQSIHPNNIGSSYCPVDDILIGELTVRETLRYSARLNPVNESSEECEKRIQSLIEVFGLSGVADQVIGTLLKRSLSGGQKRRVAVLVELVKQKNLLLLDEPTRYVQPHITEYRHNYYCTNISDDVI